MMKFIFLLLVICISAKEKSVGQGYGIEVLSGFGTGILKSSDVNLKTSNRAGLSVGVLGSLQIRNSIFIESGLLYSPKGGFIVTTSGILNFFNIPSRNEIIINYVDIPILLSANSENLRFYLGPQLSLLTRAKLDRGNSGSDLEEIKPFFYSSDIGLRMGVGYVSKIGVSGRLDYSIGFKDVYKDPNEVWRTKCIQIFIGYKYLDQSAKQALKDGSKDKSNKNFVPIHRKFD